VAARGTLRQLIVPLTSFTIKTPRRRALFPPKTQFGGRRFRRLSRDFAKSPAAGNKFRRTSSMVRREAERAAAIPDWLFDDALGGTRKFLA
jgi:hypothetical protein